MDKITGNGTLPDTNGTTRDTPKEVRDAEKLLQPRNTLLNMIVYESKEDRCIQAFNIFEQHHNLDGMLRSYTLLLCTNEMITVKKDVALRYHSALHDINKSYEFLQEMMTRYKLYRMDLIRVIPKYLDSPEYLNKICSSMDTYMVKTILDDLFNKAMNEEDLERTEMIANLIMKYNDLKKNKMLDYIIMCQFYLIHDSVSLERKLTSIGIFNPMFSEMLECHKYNMRGEFILCYGNQDYLKFPFKKAVEVFPSSFQ